MRHAAYRQHADKRAAVSFCAMWPDGSDRTSDVPSFGALCRRTAETGGSAERMYGGMDDLNSGLTSEENF